MALSLEQKTDKYVDTPLTNFPVKEDAFDRMMDVTSELIQLVIQYNKFFQAGNMAECNKLMQDNPDLVGCFFNADKYNQIRDAIIALERYYLEDIEPFINEVAQHAIGLNDYPAEEQKHLVAYSAKKIETLIKESFKNYEIIIPVTFKASAWTGEQAPYEQVVIVPDITEEDAPDLVKYYIEDFNVEKLKEYNKAFGFMSDGCGETKNGSILWKCIKKPKTDITIGLKGIFSNIVFPSTENALFTNMGFGTDDPSEWEYYAKIDDKTILQGDLTIDENGVAETVFMGQPVKS